MGTVSTTLPSDGQTIDAADVNTPINAILSEFNGNIDNDNIKSAAAINGSKIADATITNAKLAALKTNQGVYAMLWEATSLGTGSKTITGVGFKPRVVIVQGHARSSISENSHASGMACDTGSSIYQYSHGGYSNDGGQNYNVYSGSNFVSTTSTSTQLQAAVTSFDSDGITVNITTNTGSSTYGKVSLLFLA